MTEVIASREEKPLSICWINEQKKILSFHFEDGYTRKEFYSKAEFEVFIVSAADDGYRIQ